MGGVRITRHAAKRWRERVHPCTYREATAEIMAHATAIETAAAFGADTVKLGTNHRLKLAGATVLTVLPQGAK
jgi:TnpA family transposase